ncbi:MAG TPA: hypothetical protein VFJ84_01690 [Candidatus Saccharimonadales bacterium]|nr:hypothetical protein [Candidatus Saccharimonadales bacterium]
MFLLLSLITAIAVSGTALGGDAQPPATVSTAAASTTANTAVLQRTKRRIYLYVKSARRWQALMGMPASKASHLAYATTSVAYARWSLKKWMSLSARLHARARRWMSRRTAAYQSSVRLWRRSMGAPEPRRQLASAGSIEARFNRWRRMARQAYSAYDNPPQKSNFECIHTHEGSWTDRDSGGNGHYGGVQMGKAEWDKFGKPYTGKDYPYQASKLDQLWAAARYWEVSGFSPWSQTAPLCGL